MLEEDILEEDIMLDEERPVEPKLPEPKPPEDAKGADCWRLRPDPEDIMLEEDMLDSGIDD
jgi:hypothetical protein